jgi:hypothetical protein
VLTEPDADDAVPGRTWTPGRVAVVIVMLALGAMWGYVLYLAFGPGRQPPIDRLDDPAFAQAAEQRCAEALEVIGDLPSAEETRSNVERGEVVDEANAELAAMLDDLDALVPDGEDGRYVREWLDDWRLYLGDRERYAAKVRRDPEAPFLVSVKPGENRQVTGWIDEFAKANRMPACESPDDV